MRFARLIPFSLAAVLICALAGGTSAADAAAPFTDADPAARYVPLSLTTTEGGARRDRLRAVGRILARNPSHPVALTERGFQRHARGEHDLAEADYAAALVAAGDDTLVRRRVLWSHGWALFNAGLDQPALLAWGEAWRLHGGQPFWVPYTRALAQWRSGQRDAAVASWDEAVRAMPEWGTDEGLVMRTRYWPRAQFETASAVYAAWQEAGRP